MNSKLRKILFAAIGGFFLGWCLMYVAQSYGGDYVTYQDAKTGARYYGDAVPPSAPTNVQIEVRRHEGVPTVGSGWTEAERTKADQLRAIAPKPIPTQPSAQMQRQYIPTYSGVERSMAEADHNFNRPTRPSTDRTARDFNRITGQQQQYEDKMFNWNARGRELRQQYGGSGGGIGFGFYPGAYHE